MLLVIKCLTFRDVCFTFSKTKRRNNLITCDAQCGCEDPLSLAAALIVKIMPGACFPGGESCFPPHGIPILQMLSVAVALPLPCTLNWQLCNFPHMLSYQQQAHSSVPECLFTELYSTRTLVAFWLTLNMCH